MVSFLHAYEQRNIPCGESFSAVRKESGVQRQNSTRGLSLGTEAVYVYMHFTRQHASPVTMSEIVPSSPPISYKIYSLYDCHAFPSPEYIVSACNSRPSLTFLSLLLLTIHQRDKPL